MRDAERSRLVENLSTFSDVLLLARDLRAVDRLTQEPHHRVACVAKAASVVAAAARAPEPQHTDSDATAAAIRAAQKAYRRLIDAVQARLADTGVGRGSDMMSAASQRLEADAASLDARLGIIRGLLDDHATTH